LPEALLISDLDQIYGEEHEIAERVWGRLNRHVAQASRESTRQKHLEDPALHILVKEARPMKTRETQQLPTKKRWHALETFAAIIIIAALVGSMVLLFQLRRPSQSSQVGSSGAVTATAAPAAKATSIPVPPDSVMIRVSAAGISPNSQGEITIPSGTKVTLSVLPDHSLLPFQTFTMGIYATDPYGFSELQYCTYPNTDTCSYTVAYSSSERTDYTKGKHTFRAFLGNIGGAILKASNSVTITWS
jgi:hypothetical protein